MDRTLQLHRSVQHLHPASPASRAVTLTDGRSISLIESLGRGSCGTVYRGVVESNWGVQRPVAVKIVSLSPDVDPTLPMQELGRIARRAACIRHPSFIQLLEVDRTTPYAGHGWQPFIVSELVEGESLATLLDAWSAENVRVPLDFATVVALHTAEALGAALFSEGIDGVLTGLVHGALSPRQIRVSSQGEVKVGDFGQSTLQSCNSHIRSRSRLAFTAPEVATGAPANARSDVFSLGIILHEMLIGPRFPSGTSYGAASRMVEDGAIHSTVLTPNLPRGLRDVILKATAKDPMERYAHAHSMAFDLRREMFRLGLYDARTSIRHAIVGWCDVRDESPAKHHLKLVPKP